MMSRYNRTKEPPRRCSGRRHDPRSRPLSATNDIPYGCCQCGCGGQTRLASRTYPLKGMVKGKPLRYLYNHQARAKGPAYVEQDCGHETPCWIWQRRISAAGYGGVDVDGRSRLAYNVWWEREYGPIPTGMQLDHICHNKLTCAGGPACIHRRCVNPDHLEPVTPLENARRSNAGAHLATRTHCPQGHEYTPENTYRGGPYQSRGCRICRAAASKRYYAAKALARVAAVS